MDILKGEKQTKKAEIRKGYQDKHGNGRNNHNRDRDRFS